MRKKKCLALLLCLAMLPAMLPLHTWAATEYNNCAYGQTTFPPSIRKDEVMLPFVLNCSHENMKYTAFSAPTCTQQGTQEFWHCDDCGEFYQNHNFEEPVRPTGEEKWRWEQPFTLPALGHSYDAEDFCENCGMKRPLYTQVSTLEAFDALHPDTSYLIVIRDGEKTYAAHLPIFINPCDTDSDGDGIMDVLEMDTNGNAIPDCVEILFADWCDCDMDGDGDVDEDDYRFFVADLTGAEVIDMEAYKLFLDDNYWDISMIYEEQAFGVPNFVEVTMAADGSITLTDEGAMEFMLMSAGVCGGAPYSQEDFVYYDIQDTERVCAAWVPNYWIGASGNMGYYGEDHLISQLRTYGDNQYPGILDHKNWKISFHADATACLVDTWEYYDDTGALQFVKYTDENGNEAMTLVGLPQWLWADSYIMQNRIESLPVYLYASEPVFGHAHSWDKGVTATEPTCVQAGEIVYTCTDCGATKNGKIEPLGHDWSAWVFDSEAVHVRHCKRECGVAEEREDHHWTAWAELDESTHKSVCSLCKGEQSEEHHMDGGIVTKAPTHTEAGIKIYTCFDCGYHYEESIPTTPEHIWSDWIANGDGTHTRSCECQETENLPCQWDAGVMTEEPNCTESGSERYTCTVCAGTKTVILPATGHREITVEGIPATCTEAGYTSHKACSCCDYTEGKEVIPATGHSYASVVTAPTCTEGGYTTHTCANCGDSYRDASVEPIGHSYESETAKPTCTESGSITYTCHCGDSYTEEIAATGHSHASTVTKEPTCTDMGVKTYACHCGDTYTEEIAATGHSYEAVVSEPTCTAGGYTTHTCPGCGDSYVTDETEALDHNYVDGSCTRCGQLEVELGDVNGDGSINTRDARLLLRYIAGLVEKEELMLAAADFNGDGQINTRDARLLLRYIAGLTG